MNNDIDDALKIVQKAQENAELKNAVNMKENQIQNAKLEKNKRKSERREIVRKNQKGNRRKFTLTFVSGALIASLLTIGISDAIGDTIKIGKAKKVLKDKAMEVLVEQGLAEKDNDGKITVKDNEISDYECLDLTHASPLEQHIYSEVLGSEFDDAIQTASYNNGGYYYIGASQWRSINGYVDKDSEKPSVAEQNVAMKNPLLKAYIDNCEGIIRSSEELNQINVKKGK